MGDRLPAGKPPQFITSHSGQLSLLPPAGQKMSTGQSPVTLCAWGVKAGMVHSIALVDKRVGGIPERFGDEFLMAKRYTNLRLLYLF